jgi:glycosyltransferase involved in cell wall biosynthesis
MPGSLRVMYVEKPGPGLGWWRALLREWRPDFVHVNSLFSLRFALLPLWASQRLPGVQRIVAPRGMLGAAALAIKPEKKRVFLAVARAVFRGVRWHASTGREAEEIRLRFPNANVFVAQNLPAQPPTMGPPRPRDRWVLAVVGRIHPVKRVHVVLEALAAYGGDHPWELHIVGPPEDAAYMNQCRAAADACKHPVFFLGGLAPEAVGQVLDGAHFLLSPTQQENFGHAIVEAWSRGCGVVISDQTPWRQLETRGIGWDGPVSDGAWTRGLHQMLQLTPGEWEALSARARAFYRSQVLDEQVLAANQRIFEP